MRHVIAKIFVFKLLEKIVCYELVIIVENMFCNFSQYENEHKLFIM